MSGIVSESLLIAIAIALSLTIFTITSRYFTKIAPVYFSKEVLVIDAPSSRIALIRISSSEEVVLEKLEVNGRGFGGGFVHFIDGDYLTSSSKVNRRGTVIMSFFNLEEGLVRVESDGTILVNLYSASTLYLRSGWHALWAINATWFRITLPSGGILTEESEVFNPIPLLDGQSFSSKDFALALPIGYQACRILVIFDKGVVEVRVS